MIGEAETIARDGTDTTATHWADMQTLWAQYQSWQKHDQLLTDSQDKLSSTSPDTAKDLEGLLGSPDDLTLAGQQLQAALMERLNELEKLTRQAELSFDQQQKLTQIRTRLSREMELRSLGNVEPNYDRER